MPNVIMLSTVYAQCQNQVHNAECRYTECHHAECRGAHAANFINLFFLIGVQMKFQ